MPPDTAGAAATGIGLRLSDCLIVLLGSGLGGVARYVVGLWLASRSESAFPWGTFVVNVSGCFLIGVLMGILAARGGQAWHGWRLLLGIGFLGGYTTFSTLLFDTWRLGPRSGLINFLGSGAAGYVAVIVGTRLARLFNP